MGIPHPDIPGLTEWKPLARGGFAVVWQARQQSLDRLVAVKVDRRKLDDEAEQRRFLREAGAAGRMSGHPGIITVHDAGILSDDRPYLVMDLCAAGSLTQYLRPENRMSQERVRDIGVRLADALAAAHSRGVQHRDVKPANILVDRFDQAGLADFGLAAVPGPEAELTTATLEALTPAYAPPEAFRLEPATEFGDVFSLAATLYALLAGRPPRHVDTATQTVAEVVDIANEPIAPLPGVHPELMAVLLEALADQPQDRPTAAQFRDRLAAIDLSGTGARTGQGSGAVAAVPAAGFAGSEQRERRRRTALAAGLLALALIVALAAVIWGSAATGANAPLVGGPSSAVSSGVPSSDQPSPSSSPSSAQSSTVAAPPPGFADCSDDLGEGDLCPAAVECWAGLFSYMDAPLQGTLVSCSRNHVYQTFAAGRLPYPVRRQSQLTEDRRVQKLCSRRVLNSRLIDRRAGTDWEIIALPPQPDVDDDLFRCIFGNGERTSSFPLRTP